MYNGEKILAIIPARGGSKGIKNKNIIDLCGKPLISYTIESALNSKYIAKERLAHGRKAEDQHRDRRAGRGDRLPPSGGHRDMAVRAYKRLYVCRHALCHERGAHGAQDSIHPLRRP